jgi:membrane-associated phospholipid phosphatase
VFGVATSFAYIVTKRRPDMDHPWAVWVAALTVATPVPILRVNAGSHFWTDTITGTVVGVGTGLIVPFLHEHDAPGGVALRPHAGPGTIGLAGSF